ncbi:MAG: hypothetical protein AAF990_21280 [Bacteroidota bacterium]
MKYTYLTMLCLVCSATLSFSQVKRTFTDDTYAQTTVVIKEDNTEDAQVLMNQFDLDQFGMDEQIRITTEDLPDSQPPKKILASSLTPTSAGQEQLKQARNRTAIQTTAQKNANHSTEKPQKSISTQTVAATQAMPVLVNRTPSNQKTAETTQQQSAVRAISGQSSGLYPRKSSSLPRGKRVKLKKRKKFKRKRYSCYKF